jgi:hypothetical protein
MPIVVYGLVFTGFVFLLLSIIGTDHHWPIWGVAFLRDLGLLLSAVMGGTLVHEQWLRRETEMRIIDEVEAKLEDKIPSLQVMAEAAAGAVHDRFCKEPPGMTGLRLLRDVRRNSPEYYSWTTEREPQTMFFAGRSILHRIDADIRVNTGGSVEEVLLRRLTENSKITILFLDPRVDILKRLAAEEGEALDSMLGNIAISLGICKRLAERLKKTHRDLPPGAHLSIRIYDHIPYFAYHKQNNQVIIGFYFLSIEGSLSASYEVVDEKTKKIFEEHFLKIRADATSRTLVDLEGARGIYKFNDGLFDELCSFLKTTLDPKKVDELLGLTPVSPEGEVPPRLPRADVAHA